MPSGPMNVLAQSELCRGLIENEIRTLHALSEELQAAAGQVLFREGDAGDALYLVISGEMEVLKGDGNGRDRQLATVGRGAVLGEMSLVQSGAPRSATVRALGASSQLTTPGPERAWRRWLTAAAMTRRRRASSSSGPDASFGETQRWKVLELTPRRPAMRAWETSSSLSSHAATSFAGSVS